MRAAVEIHLTKAERVTLMRWSRSRSMPARQVQRAQMILLAAKGHSNADIAEELSVKPHTVGRWRSRFSKRRLAGIQKDLPRGGRPRANEEVESEIIRMTTQESPPNATCQGSLCHRVTGALVPVRSGGGMHSLAAADPTNLVLVAAYTYDVFNRRVTRTVVGEATYGYSWDGWREAQEAVLEPLGASYVFRPRQQYVWGHGLDELAAFRDLSGSSPATYRVPHGGQDTPSKLIDDQGATVLNFEYDAFGEASVFVAAGKVDPGFPFRWKGMRVDPEHGNGYRRHRYLSFRLGRWLTRDPIGSWADVHNLGNAYSYVGNAPGSFSDPTGLKGEWHQIIPQAGYKETAKHWGGFEHHQAGNGFVLEAGAHSKLHNNNPLKGPFSSNKNYNAWVTSLIEERGGASNVDPEKLLEDIREMFEKNHLTDVGAFAEHDYKMWRRHNFDGQKWWGKNRPNRHWKRAWRSLSRAGTRAQKVVPFLGYYICSQELKAAETSYERAQVAADLAIGESPVGPWYDGGMLGLALAEAGGNLVASFFKDDGPRSGGSPGLADRRRTGAASLLV